MQTCLDYLSSLVHSQQIKSVNYQNSLKYSIVTFASEDHQENYTKKEASVRNNSGPSKYEEDVKIAPNKSRSRQYVSS